MATIMQRPRTTQPNDYNTHSGDADYYRGSVPRMSAAVATTFEGNTNSPSLANAATAALNKHSGFSSSGADSPSLQLGMFDHQVGAAHAGPSRLPTSDTALYPQPSSTSSSSYAGGMSMYGHSGLGEALRSVQHGGHSSLHDGADATGIFDDPAILALVDQPFDPGNDFGLDVEREELAAMQRSQAQSSSAATIVANSIPQPRPPQSMSSSSSTYNPQHASVASAYPPSSSSYSTATSAALSHPTPTITTVSATEPEFTLTSLGGILQFPELPASLLDQAPEYEYSTHTQANVFDAVQDYQGAGHDEAARIFGLDNYDPALNLAAATVGHAGQNTDELWRYNETMPIMQQHRTDPATGSSFGHHGVLSGDAFTSSFTDASPLMSSSEYGFEPSSAPTSRGSDWKLDSNGAFGTSNGMGLGGGVNAPYGKELASPNAKRRRENSTEANRAIGESRPFYSTPGGHHASALKATYGAGSGQGVEMQHAANANAALLARQQQQLSREPMVPSQGPTPSQRTRMTSWSDNHLDEPQRMSADSWQAQVPLNAYGNNGHSGGGQYGVTTFRSAGGVQSDGHDDETSDMINAIGSAIDASIETEGVAKCPYPNCSKTFAKNRSYNLKAHLRSHSQLKPFQCIHCPRAFSRKHDLERHTRVHSGDKPYLCEACGKGFPRSDALRRHWRVEKECGDKAVEIEAKQPLPSLPPGVNMPAAQAKGPVPGLMHFTGPTTTATAGSAGMGLAPGVNPFLPVYNAFGPGHPGSMGGGGGMPVSMSMPGWDSNVPTANAYANTYPAMGDRKRMREEM